MLQRAARPDDSYRILLSLLLGITIAASLSSIEAFAAFDPATEQQILPDDRTAGDQFGISVAVDSSVGQGYLVVGALGNDQVNPDAGKAYVFERGSGPWTQMDELFAPDSEGSDRFGFSVAIDGDTLAVGAPNARKNSGNPAAGAVYVFEYQAAGDEWVFQQKLTALDGVSGDAFGWAVDIQGDTIAVGALEKDSGLGAAYAFVRDDLEDWSEQGKLVDPDGEAGDFLGISVSLDGDTIAVGAYKDTVLTGVGDLEKGSVSIFKRSLDAWSFDEKVFSFGGGQFIEFGSSVALQGSELFVGAPNDTPPFMQGSPIRVTGTVYRYNTTANPISSSQVRIWPSDKDVLGGPREFGFSLGLDGDVLAIGAYADGAGSGGTDAGSVYLYDLDDNLLNESLKLTAPVPNPGDVFGFSVAVSEDDIAVGADREDFISVTDDNAGAAYVYSLPEAGTVASSLAALAAIALLRRRRP
jgi:hypothetical protein